MAKADKDNEREMHVFGITLYDATLWFVMIDFALCAIFDVKAWIFFATITPMIGFCTWFYYYRK